MKKYLVLILLSFTVFSCKTEVTKKKGKAIRTDVGFVTIQLSFKTSNTIFRHYSVSKNGMGATNRFDYHCDSSLHVTGSTRRSTKNEPGFGNTLSIYTDLGRDTLFLDDIAESKGEKHYNIHFQYLIHDSIVVQLENSSVTVNCFARLSNDLSRDEEYVYVSPKFGYLYAYMPFYGSTQTVVKHPKLSKQDLEKVKKAIEENLDSLIPAKKDL